MHDFFEAIRYIIGFLLGEEQQLVPLVRYMTKEEAVLDARQNTPGVYIEKSGFFDWGRYGSKASLPRLPLAVYEGIRIFYGEAAEEPLEGGSLLIHADFVASTYFLLTRYEEYVLDSFRDDYGCYPARQSFSYVSGGGDLTEPLVDEYGRILRQKLLHLGYRVRIGGSGFSKIYFTHDIDVPFHRYASFEKVLRTEAYYLVYNHRIVVHPLLNWLGIYWANPRATWGYMLAAEKLTSEKVDVPMESICFIVATNRADVYTMDYIGDRKTTAILDEMRAGGAIFGLHTSYEGAADEAKMREEKERLETALGHKVTYHRNHYLRQLQPSDMRCYENVGFTDDFTTGYNDVAGFKLGTSRPVRFIDPADGRLHDILLHPLLIMDGSLSGAAPYQMGLGFEEAKAVSKKILDAVYRHHGEVNVLFHNGMFEDIPGNYHKDLYDWMLEYILQLQTGGMKGNRIDGCSCFC